MKKIMIIAAICMGLAACDMNSDQGGVVNDGIKAPLDPNGALKDSPGFVPNPTIDTAIGDDRVGTAQRDSGQKKQQR